MLSENATKQRAAYRPCYLLRIMEEHGPQAYFHEQHSLTELLIA